LANPMATRLTLELAVDLLARLYPRLAIAPIGDSVPTQLEEYAARLSERARAINPGIDLQRTLDDVTICLVAGGTALDHGCAAIYLGSDGWIARTTTEGPVSSGASNIPFGAGAASCFGTAAIFRQVFAPYLPTRGRSAIGVELNVSLLDLAPENQQPPNALWSGSATIDIGDCYLVGAGAIGNGVLWALSRAPDTRGTLHVVDGESIDLTNLQRYILTCQESVGDPKVVLAERAFAPVIAGNRIAVVPHALHWGPFVRARGRYTFDRVLLAVDSAEDRIAVQASLPRWIANAWTQPENVGVSRHDFLGDGPCVACLYMPSGRTKNRDTLYAEVLGTTDPEELLEVRKLLFYGCPVGRAFLERTAARLGRPLEQLLPFENVSLEAFYVGAVCGGMLLGLGQTAAVNRATQVPMAFQSALAGILLAAELIADAGHLRSSSLPARTEIDLLRPGATRFNSPAAKHPSGRCLCQDESFRSAYGAKYASLDSLRVSAA
jgi:hypothetical protein